MTVRVAWIHIAPIKGLHVQERSSVELRTDGVPGDRRFCIIDDAGRMLNAKRVPRFVAVRPRLDDAMTHLTLSMPDGSEVEGEISVGEPVVVSYPSRTVDARVIEGPWSEALSDLAGVRVRLARIERAGEGVDRGERGAVVTILSEASLDALARAANVSSVDPRRFRMLFGVAGIGAHEEDTWIGRAVRIGDAVVRPGADVGRCAVTTLDPDRGVSDLDTLKTIARYRGAEPTTERVAFGVWARVERPGVVRVGDAVTV